MQHSETAKFAQPPPARDPLKLTELTREAAWPPAGSALAHAPPWPGRGGTRSQV